MPKITTALRAFTLASAILFAVSGCGGGKDDDANPPGQSAGTVSGRVADAQTGEAIAGVDVTIGTLKATSDANGKYSLPGVPLGAQVVAQFTKASYASNFATVEVINGKTSTADRRLAKVAVKQDVSAATGGTVVVAGSAAQVVLPAAGFVNAATGAAATGTVSVEVTPINPALNPLNMPGNYRAQGEAVPIESFGALQVELRDAAGAMLNLAPGKNATIRIPVPEGAGSPPLTIPLYYFKESTGLWVREGTATLAGSRPQQYYEGQVSHFTVWNADQPYETIFINGCVVNTSGQPVDATVMSEGIDYIGSATVFTTADGKFKVPARRSSQVQVSASSGGNQDAVVVTTGLTDMTLPACLVVAQKPPVIVVQPTSLTLAFGMLETLSVTANNAQQYKWYRNGELISSGSRNLAIFGSASAAGTYRVVVSNAYGSVTSVDVTVTVAVPVIAPTILAQPQDITVLAGATPSFAVQAVGDSLTYQWLRNGVEIASAQGPKLTLAPVVAGDNGALFSVRVKNAAGTVISANAVLTVAAEAVAPTIAAQPANASVSVGQSATFVVLASGTAPFTYQWLRNGAAITDATAASYQTPATTLADSGAKYTVRVTNAKGNVLSSEASLTVSQGTSVAGLHLAFPSALNVNGQIGYGAIPAAGGTAVPFWPVGAGEVAQIMVGGQLNNGVGSNIHVPGMLFWKNQQLIRRDLIGATGLPAEVRVSSLTSAGLCEGGNDFAQVGADVTDVNRTWYVYRKSGNDGQCNTFDDRFLAVRANMGPADAPLDVARPYATVHAANGALTGWVVRNGNTMQRVNPDFTSPVTLFTLPASDLYFQDDATLDNHWVFESGSKIYGVNLGAAPAVLTEITTVAAGEGILEWTYANQRDVVVVLSNGVNSRILRYMPSTKAVNQVAAVSGVTSSVVVTPTRVVLNGDLLTLRSVLLTGGTPQTIFNNTNNAYMHVDQRGGERLWFGTGSALVSINSDGSGQQSLTGARIAGCILKPLAVLEGSLESCDAVMVLEGTKVSSYDAVSGALRVTYGNVTIPDVKFTSMVFFGFLTSWGQTGVLSHYMVDTSNANTQSVVSYLLKTDQPGLTKIVLP
jgi:hypothetical protein